MFRPANIKVLIPKVPKYFLEKHMRLYQYIILQAKSNKKTKQNKTDQTYFPSASISVVILSNSFIAEKSLLVDSNLMDDKS